MRALSLSCTLAACVVVSAFGLVAMKLSKAEKEAERRRKRVEEEQARAEETCYFAMRQRRNLENVGPCRGHSFG